MIKIVKRIMVTITVILSIMRNTEMKNLCKYQKIQKYKYLKVPRKMSRNVSNFVKKNFRRSSILITKTIEKTRVPIKLNSKNNNEAEFTSNFDHGTIIRTGITCKKFLYENLLNSTWF